MNKLNLIELAKFRAWETGLCKVYRKNAPFIDRIYQTKAIDSKNCGKYNKTVKLCKLLSRG